MIIIILLPHLIFLCILFLFYIFPIYIIYLSIFYSRLFSAFNDIQFRFGITFTKPEEFTEHNISPCIYFDSVQKSIISHLHQNNQQNSTQIHQFPTFNPQLDVYLIVSISAPNRSTHTPSDNQNSCSETPTSYSATDGSTQSSITLYFESTYDQTGPLTLPFPPDSSDCHVFVCSSHFCFTINKHYFVSFILFSSSICVF